MYFETQYLVIRMFGSLSKSHTDDVITWLSYKALQPFKTFKNNYFYKPVGHDYSLSKRRNVF